MNINEVDALINLIAYKKSISEKKPVIEKDIAVALGYNSDYISQQRARGKYTKTFINQLKEKYADVIESQEKIELKPEDVETVIYSIAARQKVHGHYLAELFALEKGVSVAKIISEMEQLEKDTATSYLKARS